MLVRGKFIYHFCSKLKIVIEMTLFTKIKPERRQTGRKQHTSNCM